MIEITDKQLCCGCSACANVCPKHCIEMIVDQEGFSYPWVDAAICIECGLCEKVCPFVNPYDKSEPLEVHAANNKNTKIRMESSSGGLFSIMAERVILEGGVVFGARYDENWQVILDYTETIEGIALFRGSKYVQSRVANAYIDSCRFLKDGRKVLFSGTPCQIAGLNHFLRKDFDNLITVDFVCHGVPSPKVWGKYLDEVTHYDRSIIREIKFRDKSNGWKKYFFDLSMDNAHHTRYVHSWHQQNPYMQAFLSNLILRPSCHHCRAKEGRSMSDLTIADFWGVDKTHPEMDDDKGTGLLIVNSLRGKLSFQWTEIDSERASLKEAKPFNPGLGCDAHPHHKRTRFFAQIDTRKKIIKLIYKSLRKSMFKRIYNKLKKMLATIN